MQTFKINFELKVNKLVQLFVLSDFFLLTGWGFVGPIFSIYIIRQIPGASLLTVGWASFIYLLVKSVVQVPIAHLIDKWDGETDDFYVLVVGLLLLGITAFLFIVVSTVWYLYFVQILHAFAMALYAAAWPAIVGRHLDKDRQAFEWTLDSTAIGIGSGFSGLGGSAMATYFGYSFLFALVGILSILGAFVILFVPTIALPRKTLHEVLPFKNHDPNITHSS